MPEWKMAAKQSEIWFNCIKSLLPACNILQNSTCFQVWIHSWLKIVLLGTFTHCFTFVHLQCCNLKRFFSHFSLLLIRDSLCSSLHSSIPFYWLWGPLDSVLVPEGQVEIQRGSLLVCNKCFHEGAPCFCWLWLQSSLWRRQKSISLWELINNLILFIWDSDRNPFEKVPQLYTIFFSFPFSFSLYVFWIRSQDGDSLISAHFCLVTFYLLSFVFCV